jgi:hypothetical protein
MWGRSGCSILLASCSTVPNFKSGSGFQGGAAVFNWSFPSRDAPVSSDRHWQAHDILHPLPTLASTICHPFWHYVVLLC